MNAMSALNNPFSGGERYDPEQETLKVGALLTEGMATLGIGPTEVAQATGLRRQHVQQMMRGVRPLYVEHLRRLPEPLRDWMLRRMLRRWGQTIADRLPPGAQGLRRGLTDLATAGLEGAELLHQLWGHSAATASIGPRVRAIGERAMRAGASLIDWADEVERERVLPLEDEAS